MVPFPKGKGKLSPPSLGEGLGERSSGTLFIVATPIGNLEDITLRALRILKECDLIIAEDTRRSRQLLQHYQIGTPFERSLYQGAESDERLESYLRKLRAGAKIALISDAGTPLISDPGYELVQRAVAENISVIPVPGPTALIAALVASGLPTDRFVFVGVPPKKAKARRAFFARLQNEMRTVVIYESPHRVLDTLAVMSDCFPDRQIALCRELTKMHEEILRGTAGELLEILKARPSVQGEVTIVLAGALSQAGAEGGEDLALSVVEHVQKLMSEGLEKKEAVKRVARLRGLAKRAVYEQVVRRSI